MNEHDIAEQAYKNGYEAGKADAVKHGRWEMARYPLTQCSICGAVRNCENERGWNYCPYCGAKMDGDE